MEITKENIIKARECDVFLNEMVSSIYPLAKTIARGFSNLKTIRDFDERVQVLIMGMYNGIMKCDVDSGHVKRAVVLSGKRELLTTHAYRNREKRKGDNEFVEYSDMLACDPSVDVEGTVATKGMMDALYAISDALSSQYLTYKVKGYTQEEIVEKGISKSAQRYIYDQHKKAYQYLNSGKRLQPIKAQLSRSEKDASQRKSFQITTPNGETIVVSGYKEASAIMGKSVDSIGKLANGKLKTDNLNGFKIVKL